jgi:hypothetical protein
MDLRGGQPRSRVVRVSSALDLDLTNLVEETTRQVTEAMMPALAEVKQAVETLTGLMFPAGLMGQDDARATLCSMLPAGFLSGAATAEQVADFQFQRLTEAGYAVVPVAGAALEHAIKVAQHRRTLYATERERRADERLAQATRDPEDSWREDQ